MNKTVLIAGVIGLFFGFLFSATLGVQLFPDDQTDPVVLDDNQDDEGATLRKDAEAFKVAYNLTTSIYLPVTGDEVYQMIEDGETFLLYAGRETCPYCQVYVPVLQEAANNEGVDVIYYIDTRDPLNADFVSMESVTSTPTTFIFSSGTLEERFAGFKNLEDTEMLIMDNLS